MHPGEVVYLPGQWHHAICNHLSVDKGEILNAAVGYIGGVDHLPDTHLAAFHGNTEA